MGGKLPTLQALSVIANYLRGGTAYVKMRGQKWQRLVFKKINAIHNTLVGWTAIILLWQKVKSPGGSVFAKTQNAVNGPPILTFEIVGTTSFIYSMEHLILNAISDTAPLTKKKVSKLSLWQYFGTDLDWIF